MSETLAAGSGVEHCPLTEQRPTGSYPHSLLSFLSLPAAGWVVESRFLPLGMGRAGVTWRGPRKPWLEHRREPETRLSDGPWTGGDATLIVLLPTVFNWVKQPRGCLWPRMPTRAAPRSAIQDWEHPFAQLEALARLPRDRGGGGCSSPPASVAALLQAGKSRGAHIEFLGVNLPWETSARTGEMRDTLQAQPQPLCFPLEHLDGHVPSRNKGSRRGLMLRLGLMAQEGRTGVGRQGESGPSLQGPSWLPGPAARPLANPARSPGSQWQPPAGFHGSGKKLMLMKSPRRERRP